MALESLLDETRRFPPADDVVRRAHFDADGRAALTAKAEADPLSFWAELARQELVWDEDFETVLDDAGAPFYKWFPDGRLNASVQCLDRHLPAKGNDVAIAWEAEDGTTREVTYGSLHRDVCKFSSGLRGLGVERGDRVIIYMPLVPEVVVAMLACARLGAIHSVVFGGFSADSLADRIEDTGARVVITADGAWRGGKIVPLKQNTDAAVEKAPVDTVIVLQHTGTEVSQHDRDVSWDDVVADEPDQLEPVSMAATDPLFILYTSGSTGKPKGITHGTGGYLTWARASTRWVFDLHDDDVYWCTADVGWITGHTYLVYGPLANGAKMVMYEGAPTHPGPDRFWQIVAKHGVTVLYTAPTAIRALMRSGDEWPARHDLSSLRILGTVGEPINPEAWMWYYQTIGGGRCPIVDTWWQTETGGIMVSPLPGADVLKPGSCLRPLPGIHLDILNEDGSSVQRGEGGILVIDRPWPSMMLGVWGDDERFRQTYFSRFGTKYVAGDSARHDADGSLWIMGRIDDVLNVSGHRIGTAEVESALVAHPWVAEAAVVGFPHEIKGEALHAFVVLRESDGEVVDVLRNHVAQQIGPIAKPDRIQVAQGLPKTRSGKIMRRILRAIAAGEEIRQDTSTLEDPSVVDALVAERP